MNGNDIIKKAIEEYGESNQCIVAMEELSELQKEISKILRGKGSRKHFVEELADSWIMLCQLKLMFHITNAEVDEEIEQKLIRLEGRLREEQK